MVLTQRHFPKRQLTKGIFPSGYFPNVQFSKRQLHKSFLATAVAPSPHANPSSSSRTPPVAAFGASEGLT